MSRYRLDRCLDRGPQGETWCAWDLHEHRTVALELFAVPESRAEASFQRFEQACRALQTLRHPSIPHYHEHGRDPARGLFYLSRHRVNGRSLAEHLAAGRRFSESELLELLDQLLAILEHVHGRDPAVVHGNLGPDRVILDPMGRAWLVDFGGVRQALHDEGVSASHGMPTAHDSAVAEGWPGCVGPEADIYALGVTFAAIATGVGAQALPREGLEHALMGMMSPGRLRDTLVSMVQTDPGLRIRSAPAVRRSLRAAPARRPTPTPMANPSPSPSPSRPSVVRTLARITTPSTMGLAPAATVPSGLPGSWAPAEPSAAERSAAEIMLYDYAPLVGPALAVLAIVGLVGRVAPGPVVLVVAAVLVLGLYVLVRRWRGPTPRSSAAAR